MIASVIAGVVVAAVLSPFGGKAHQHTEKGNRAYEQAEYEEALRAYTEAQVALPEAPELYYDIGNVLFRQQDYERATDAFTRALLSAPQSLAPQAAYNLGNALFMEERYDEAVDAYRRSLEARSDDDDAKRNLELAIRALQQQQQQQDQQQDDSQQQEQEQQQEQQQEDPQEQEQEQQDPQGEKPQPKPQQPGEMSPEEARRLLDGLDEDEAENLRRRARERVQEAAGTEEDW